MSGLTANLRDGNGHNRHYDKSMQIVEKDNGKAGLCFERAAVDGSVALGYAARLHHESLLLSTMEYAETPRSSLIRTRAAAWSLPPALKQRLCVAFFFFCVVCFLRGVVFWSAL